MSIPDGAAAASLLADVLGPVLGRRGRLPRLVIHAGLPKTGTTAVQHALWHGRDRLLREASVLYPASVLSDERPRHQWLPALLRRGDADAFAQRLAQTLEEAGSARTILLSGEGVSYHWRRMPATGRAVLAALGELLDTRIVLVLRPRASFAVSMWKQAVVNPPSEPEFAQPWDLETFVRHPHVAGLLDYSTWVASLRDHVRPGDVRLLPYRPGAAVDDVLRAADVNIRLPEPSWPGAGNPSLSMRATELLRRVNHEALDRAARAELVTLLRELDAGAAPDLDEPTLSDARAAAGGDAALEREMGVPAGWLSGA